MMARADGVVATAMAFLPPGARRTLYLSQGVDLAHFARVPIEPPRRRVLGFFGIIAEWIDDDLVEQAAHRLPKLTFEFVGPIRDQPRFLDAAPNIVWRGPLPYEDLPAAMANWDAAWILFLVDDLTRAVTRSSCASILPAGYPRSPRHCLNQWPLAPSFAWDRTGTTWCTFSRKLSRRTAQMPG